jgi:hypothetical protein
MPCSLRPKGLPTRVLYSILGKPANITGKRDAREKKIDEKLLSQNTWRLKWDEVL